MTESSEEQYQGFIEKYALDQKINPNSVLIDNFVEVGIIDPFPLEENEKLYEPKFTRPKDFDDFIYPQGYLTEN